MVAVAVLVSSITTKYPGATIVPNHQTTIEIANYLTANNLAPSPPPINTVFDLPEMRNDRFVGREDVLETLKSLLEDSEKNNKSGRVVVTGLGGIGKTQVALEYCYRNRGRY